MRISFNNNQVKKMTKKAFLKQHDHLKDYMDLEKFYDKLVPNKKDVKGDS